jgi:hypothetical protein
VESFCDELVDAIVPGEPFDFVEAVAAKVPMHTARHARPLREPRPAPVLERRAREAGPAPAARGVHGGRGQLRHNGAVPRGPVRAQECLPGRRHDLVAPRHHARQREAEHGQRHDVHPDGARRGERHDAGVAGRDGGNARRAPEGAREAGGRPHPRPVGDRGGAPVGHAGPPVHPVRDRRHRAPRASPEPGRLRSAWPTTRQP